MLKQRGRDGRSSPSPTSRSRTIARWSSGFPEIDLIIGGHEHFLITATENRSLISKAGSDAKFVARIDVNRRAGGTVERFYELLPITSALPDDPKTAAVDRVVRVAPGHGARRGRRHDARAARRRQRSHLRTAETNLGNLVADAIRADASADIAIINCGQHPRQPHLPRRSADAADATRDAPVRQRRLRSSRARPRGARGAEPRRRVSCRPARTVSAGLRPDDDRRRRARRRASRVRDVKVNGQPLDPDSIYTRRHPRLHPEGRRRLRDVRRTSRSRSARKRAT